MRRYTLHVLAALALVLLVLVLASEGLAQQPSDHQNLRDESIPGLVTPDTADRIDERNEETVEDQTVGSIPLATAEQEGCVTRTLPRNFSSRSGNRPALLVLHYTVSDNRAGWGDVDAIFGWFSQSRAQASSHYIIDFEGNCLYTVPETMKSWTEGFFNPWGISIEFIARGNEPTTAWLNPGLAKGAKVFAEAAERWGIPIRWGATSGCTITRSGIVDHDQLDCGNTHTDVKPNFPFSQFMALVKSAAGSRAVVDPLGEFTSNGRISKLEWKVARWYMGLGEYDRYGARYAPQRPDVPRRFTTDTWAAVRWYIGSVERQQRTAIIRSVPGEFFQNGSISPREWQAARWYTNVGEYAVHPARSPETRPSVPKVWHAEVWQAVRWYVTHVLKGGTS